MWTILGANGVIGRRLVFDLHTAGLEVLPVGRDLDVIYNRPLGNLIYAIGLTGDFRERPFETLEAHVTIVSEILKRSNFSSFLYLSSTRVYSRVPLGFEDATLPVSVHDPSDLYNLSKLMGEALCLRDVRDTVRVARLSNVVSADDCEKANFLPSLVQAAASGHVHLHTSIDSTKDYISVEDVSSLLIKIATVGVRRLYNVASGTQISHAEWLAFLAQRKDFTVSVAPSAPTYRSPPIDIERIREEFNFKPRSVLINP